MSKKLILIGLGPHAKCTYYPLIENYSREFGLELELLVELDGQKKSVEKYLSQRDLKPKNVVYLSDTVDAREGRYMDPNLEKYLNRLIRKENIFGIIISTEPKAHKIYAKWALSHDINILLDKPLTSPTNLSTDINQAKKIYTDYLDLQKDLQNSNARFYITTQRRNHAGFIQVKDILTDYINMYGIPASYFDIYHADGTWNLPHEFDKENHPYKYGYGKLMHSGYHSVDLFAWLMELNFQIPKKTPNKVRVNTNTFRPDDFLFQINNEDYKKLFKTKSLNEVDKFFEENELKKYKDYGELDANINLQFLKDEYVTTTANIVLQQNSFSRRAWTYLPEDTYKGNGRLRHERLNIQLSQILNIQVHSYQSYETKKKDVDTSGAGHEDHFDIYIFRNSELIGGKPLEKYCLGEEMREAHQNDPTYLGHNEKGRELCFLNFVSLKDDPSELDSHRLTNWLLSIIYQSIVNQNQKGSSELTFDHLQI